MNVMQLGGGGEVSRSSTADLSSPPSEPERPQSFPSPSQQLPNNEATQYASSTIRVDHHGGENYSTTSPATTSIRHTSNLQPQSQPQPAKDEKPKVKRPRKKTAAGAEAEKEKKEKPARKPRASSGTGGPARKKAKLESAATPIAPSKQPKITDYPTPLPATSATTQLKSAPTNPADFPIRTHDTSADAASSTATQPSQRQPSPPPVPRLSYDPVRSMMVERSPALKVYSTAPPNTSTPSKPVSVRTSTSPASISNIIDPPTTLNLQPPRTKTQTPAIELENDQAKVKDTGATKVDIDAPSSRPANLAKKGSSGTPSNAPSPKPGRAKEQPPPLPQGSGLLSSALFGNATGELSTSSDQAPNIVVHVKLDKKDNNIINFAQLAEEKYGFAALYPRLAAQKERLARVAAAGAALEKTANGAKGGNSAGESADDDMSVDIDRDSENEGDVAMSGVNGGGTAVNSGTDAAGPKKRRRKKVEEYDQDDPFVDDSELAWEAQAAAVKDGFFVYCGPLVPEGEKPAVERCVIYTHLPLTILTLPFSADGTVKRGRGRGRGGGPGSRGGRGAAAAANGESGGGRGGGPGSRGGTTTRKPRVTKAGRAMMEREKQDREKMAPLAAKPSGYPTPA
jgi:HPC2 and ubinuclein domain